MARNHNLSRIIQYIRGTIRDQEDVTGRDITQYNGDNKFTLSEPFVDGASIQVYVNGDIISPADWDYDSVTNRVIISMPSGNPLVSNDMIVILYSFYAKYSDAEIMAYINSALCLFVKFRYKKLFMMDDDNDVISVDMDNTDITATNDSGVTLREQQFIAIITSICIDPQNVKIKTPDIETTPPMHESKQDQLINAFQTFQRFMGSVEYLEDDNDSSAFWRFSQR
jgi:hypothetical protein